MSLSGFRGLLLAVCFGATLSGCGGSGSGGDESADANSLVTTLSTPTVNAKQIDGTQSLSISFNSSDGKPLTNLAVSGLSPLPFDWSGPSQFSCSTVSTGGSCVLTLSYTPTGAQQGTLALSYSYVNSAGATVSGSIEVPYQSTSYNNIVTAQLPAGQIVGVVGQQAQSVTIDFGSDDGAAITALELAADLGTLPAGWSVQTNPLPCATIDFGHPCALQLSYAPQAIEQGTLVLDYEYVDNSGFAKQGIVAIAYRSTVSNNVVSNLSSTRVDARIGGSKQAIITFTTDDGNQATDLALAPLPSGWSTDVSGCVVVFVGTCQVQLTYTPISASSGTLNVDYEYLDNSGQAKTGSVNVNYVGREMYAYVAGDMGVYYCGLDSAGALNNCQTTTASLTLARGIAFHDGEAYVSNFASGDIERCQVGLIGDLTSCQTFATGLSMSGQIVATESHLYVISRYPSTQRTSVCNYANGNCVQTASTISPNGIAIDGQFAYISVGGGTGTVQTCAVDSNSDLSSCFFNSAFSDPVGLAVANGFVYVADQGASRVLRCTADPVNGGLSACATLNIFEPTDIEIVGNRAYVTQSNGLSVCELSVSGMPQNCVSSTGGASFFSPLQVVID